MPRGTKRKLETPSSDEKAPKKIKLDLQHDAREQNQLPAELVLQLFRLIERAEVVQCSMVCRQWYRIGQREEFHWIFVARTLAEEFPTEYHFQRHKRLKDYAKLSFEEEFNEINVWQSDPLHLGMPVRAESKKGTDVLYLYDDRENHIATAIAVDETNFDFNNKNNALLWRYTIERTNEIVQSDSVNSGKRAWIISLFVNLKVLDSMVLQNTCKVPNTDILLHAVARERYDLRTRNYAVNTPLKSAAPEKQPDGFRDDIKLFKYQLNAITWMKSVEDRIGQVLTFTSANRWKGSVSYFDAYNAKIVHPRNISKHIHKVQIRGGILADEVGLGKTFEVLGLILAAPPKTDLEPHPELITSKSTLIMCPEHLCQQWHDEIARATTLSALVVRNYEELKQCTYEDFMTQYDVIVCPYELLSTLNYVCLPSRRTKGTLTEKERNVNVKKALEDLKTNKNFREAKAPTIEHFFFHRVVFDEGHQSQKLFFLDRSTLDLSKNVLGCRKWFVSATPFSSISTKDMFHFLGLQDVKSHIEEYRDEMIFKDYFWRNTKESVQNELVVPKTVDDVNLIEFSPIERAIYFVNHDVARNSMKDLCCLILYYERGLMSVVEQKLQDFKGHLDSLRILATGAAQSLQQAREVHALEQDQLKKKVLGIKLERLTQVAMNCQKTFNIHQNAIEILEQELPMMPSKLAQAKTREDRDMIDVQQRYGTKVAGLIVYLKKLFAEQPNSRVIIFSMGRYNTIEMLLNENGIMTTAIRGDAYKKIQSIEDFKKEMALFKVIMMNNQDNSTGTNMIEATHVLLLDPPTHNQESFETQAIGRAYRQGQTKQITVVRILFKDTVEHENYLKKNNMPLDGLITYDPQTWKPHYDHEKEATSATPVRIAKLGKSSSFSGISESELKQSLELQNNTNERTENDAQNGTESNNGTEQVGGESEHNEPQNKKPAPKKKAVKKAKK